MKRNKVGYVFLILSVVLSGLASRSQSPLLPVLFKEYAGDILWALTVYLTVGFLFPHFSIKKVALIAAIISGAVECSQLYHAEWIDRIRYTRLGGLLLGFGFLWSDLICYGIGISFGAFFERFVLIHLFFGRRDGSAFVKTTNSK